MKEGILQGHLPLENLSKTAVTDPILASKQFKLILPEYTL